MVEVYSVLCAVIVGHIVMIFWWLGWDGKQEQVDLGSLGVGTAVGFMCFKSWLHPSLYVDIVSRSQTSVFLHKTGGFSLHPPTNSRYMTTCLDDKQR